MSKDSSKPDDENASRQSRQIPLDRINSIAAGAAIAVRAVNDDSQTILAGVTTSVPEEPVTTIIANQDCEYNPDTYPSPVIDIDADTYWYIDDDGLSDNSAQLEDRPPLQRDSFADPRDPPPCWIAVTNHHDARLRIPVPNGIGAPVKEYYTERRGIIIDIATGPIVNPAQMLPDGYDSPP